MKQESIFNFTPSALGNLLVEEMHCKPFVVNQILDWIYQKGAESFSSMSNLSKDLREKLEARFHMDLPSVEYELRSKDHKTIKLKLGLKDGKSIEAVYMKEEKHSTICLSSQVGCAQACVFCATGKMGVLRNLQASEIITQILVFKRIMGTSFPKSYRLVFMGMGEPFHNTNQLFKAVEIITHEKCLQVGARRITISTSGVVKGIYRLMEFKPQVQLAISLHTVNQELRKKWVPNMRESVEDILEAARVFTEKTGRKITFEMVLFGGKYVSTARLNKLAVKLKGIRCNVNAIPYNPIEDGPAGLLRPTHEEMEHFKQILKKHQQEVTIRISRGRDIQAACGQLITSQVA